MYVLETVKNFFEANSCWENSRGVNAPAMLRSRSSFQVLVKQRALLVTGIYCFISGINIKNTARSLEHHFKKIGEGGQLHKNVSREH